VTKHEEMDAKVPVCKVGGCIVYGTKREAAAAKLQPGDRVLVNGIKEVVDYVWFYDQIIVKFKSGRSLLT
jgi:hypothetical protein